MIPSEDLWKMMVVENKLDSVKVQMLGSHWDVQKEAETEPRRG